VARRPAAAGTTIGAVLRRTWWTPAAFGTYLAISFGYFGFRVLPDPREEYIGFGDDPFIFVWSFGWWPHALGNAENPFHTDALWAPDGLNLAWITTVPALSLAYAPVTLLVDAVVAYNLAALLAPVLAALTAFWLCRHVTGAFWPSLVGGYLFGFSAYMVGHELGHLNLTGVFLLPLVALLVLRYVEGSLTAIALAWRLGLVLAVQLWISTEVFFTLTVSLLLACGLAYLVVREARPRLRTLPLPLLGAYGLTTVLGSPLLVYALVHFERASLNRPQDFGADLLNFVVPTRLIAAGAVWAPPIAERFAGNDAETTAYLGLPLLAIVAWFAVSRRRRPGSRFLALAAALGAFLALGTSLRIAGREVVGLPWGVLADQPLFNNAMPVRFSAYVALAAAVLAALWMRDTPGLAAIALPALAVLALVPRLELPLWRSSIERPSFFADGLYEDCLREGENVFTYPYRSGEPLLWQVDSGFHFRLAGGAVRSGMPETFTPIKAAWEIHFDDARPGAPDMVEFFRQKDVSRSLIEEEFDEQWHPSLEWQGAPSARGGVVVYPGCAPAGEPSG
jgi:hypothetical protein